MKRSILTFATVAASCVLYAQDLHIIPFDAAPMTINPTFTGMFNGSVRVAGSYQDVYQNTAIPFDSYTLSADASVLTLHNGSFLAAGLQLLKDVAGDNNVSNFSGLASVAYHQAIKLSGANKADIAIGVQGGYTQQSVDLVDLYFGNPLNNNITPTGTSAQYHLGLGNSVNYYSVNAGISFSENMGKQFNYTLAFSANNMNQPADGLEKTQNEEVGINKNYIASFGADWNISQRLTLRPAALIQFTQSDDNTIFGNEFQYATDIHRQSLLRNVFAAIWYRSGDVFRVAAGAQLGSFRIELGCDYAAGPASSADGPMGMEAQFRYIAHSRKPHRRNIPCSRF